MSKAEVDQYLKGLPEAAVFSLQALRKQVLDLVPAGEECISYAMPCVKLNGKAVAGYAAFKKHIGYFPHSGHIIPQLEAELADRKQTTILEFDKPSRNGEHPTMKPVALFEYQMLNNTKGGDIVLDSFGGSGTTLIAAEKNGRIARLMELDPKYVDVIIKRWQDFTGKQAIHAETGQPFAEVSNDNKEAYA